MVLNLLLDAWIPVRRANGDREIIAPWEISTDEEDDKRRFVQIDAPRPDLSGALIQFLIGVIQTVFPPRRDKDWKKNLLKPYSAEELKQAYAKFAHAFELLGEDRRFMQDIDISEVDEVKPISYLLVDMPTDNTIKKNADFFIKRAAFDHICPRCAAASLYAMQVNAPSGGQGHRTSIRGGGPLSTLLLGDSLWQTIWLNVVSASEIGRTPEELEENGIDSKYPWMAATRTSAQNETVTPQDAHPFQVYWAMPRRVLLLHEDSSIVCGLCGEKSGIAISGFLTKNYGVNYDGPWIHPLSPYQTNKDGTIGALHAQPGGITYRHWLGLGQRDADKGVRPALVVYAFFRRQRNYAEELPILDRAARLWVLGYDMDNMKARCWYEGTMPLGAVVDDRQRELLDVCNAAAIQSAIKVRMETRSAIKNALFQSPKHARGDMSFVDRAFWQCTEAHFYSCMKQWLVSIQAMTEGESTFENQGVRAAKMNWLQHMKDASRDLFDEHSQVNLIGTIDPKRIVQARQKLEKFLNGKKLLEMMDLPIKQKNPKKKSVKKSKENQDG